MRLDDIFKIDVRTSWKEAIQMSGKVRFSTPPHRVGSFNPVLAIVTPTSARAHYYST